MDLVQLVREANPGRQMSNVNRRLIKMIEECGEVSEAYLNLTSGFNGKGKTWDDMREECIDVLILAIDIDLTDNQWLSMTTCRLARYELFEDTFMSCAKNISLAYEERKSKLFLVHMHYVICAALKMVYTPMPDQADISFEDMEINIEKEMRRKLAKWSAKRAKMAVDTDDV